MMDDEDGEDSRDFESSGEETIFHRQQEEQKRQINDVSNRPESLEKTLEEVKVNAEKERKEWEKEKQKLEEEIDKQGKLLATLEKDQSKQKQNWTTIFNSKPKPVTPTVTTESSGIIGDLLAQIKELSMQRASIQDIVDDLKQDLVESKKQLRNNVMESVSLKTQIASLEEKVKTLEEDPSRPHTPREEKEDLFGNQKLIRELEQKLEDRDINVGKLDRERIKNEKRIKQLMEDLSAHTSLSEYKQKELDILVNENTVLQNTIDQQKLQIEEFQKKYEEEQKWRIQLEKKLTDITTVKESSEIEKQNLIRSKVLTKLLKGTWITDHVAELRALDLDGSGDFDVGEIEVVLWRWVEDIVGHEKDSVKMPSVNEFMATYDTDGDGKISMSEIEVFVKDYLIASFSPLPIPK